MKLNSVSFIIAFACLSAMTGTTAFYTVSVKNSTELPADVTIEHAVCGPLRVRVNVNETKDIDTNGCCSKRVIITSAGYQSSFQAFGLTAADLGGYSLEYTPPSTGLLGEACRGYSIEITGDTNTGFRINQR